jgi:HD superfamily phosphohydrolase YqeK
LLNAIGYHTFGHPGLGRLGRALYLADFLEPGRGWQPAWRAALRARLPDAMDEVLVDVAAARITHLLRRRQRIWPETHAFWNSLTESS